MKAVITKKDAIARRKELSRLALSTYFWGRFEARQNAEITTPRSYVRKKEEEQKTKKKKKKKKKKSGQKHETDATKGRRVDISISLISSPSTPGVPGASPTRQRKCTVVLMTRGLGKCLEETKSVEERGQNEKRRKDEAR